MSDLNKEVLSKLKNVFDTVEDLKEVVLQQRVDGIAMKKLMSQLVNNSEVMRTKRMTGDDAVLPIKTVSALVAAIKTEDKRSHLQEVILEACRSSVRGRQHIDVYKLFMDVVFSKEMRLTFCKVSTSKDEDNEILICCGGVQLIRFPYCLAEIYRSVKREVADEPRNDLAAVAKRKFETKSANQCKRLQIYFSDLRKYNPSQFPDEESSVHGKLLAIDSLAKTHLFRIMPPKREENEELYEEFIQQSTYALMRFAKLTTKAKHSLMTSRVAVCSRVDDLQELPERSFSLTSLERQIWESKLDTLRIETRNSLADWWEEVSLNL